MIRVETQALLDGFAAAGLAAYVAALLLRRAGGPLTSRLDWKAAIASRSATPRRVCVAMA